MYSSVNTFNGGEMSPLMECRYDVSQYAKGCSTLKNFLVTPFGTAEKRKGFVHITDLDGEYARVFPFRITDDTTYLVIFSDKKISIYQDDQFITLVESCYTESDIATLQVLTVVDIMFICHQNYPLMQLKRKSNSEFTLEELEFEYPPTLDPNLTDTTITPTGVDGAISLLSSEPIFYPEHVGSYWQLIHKISEHEIEKDFTSDGITESIEVFGAWSLVTHGTWTGKLYLQRSSDFGKTWEDFRTYDSANDSNVFTSGTEEDDNIMYRLRMSNYAQSDTGTLRFCRALLENADYQKTGIVHITSYVNEKEVRGTVTRKLGTDKPTKEWNEPAFSKYRGYPRAIAIFEERMVLGGTNYQPQTIWMSKVNDWDNYLLSDLDDAGLSYTLNSDTLSTIKYFVAHDILVIGTTEGEFTASASDSSEAMTPGNAVFRRRSVYGCENIPGVRVGSVVLFVQRGGRKVREFVYSWESDSYYATNLTELAEHITESGIREIALQRQPNCILWCVLNNGSLAAMTYEREQEVIAWHRHDSDLLFKSLAVVKKGENEILYVICKIGENLCFERIAIDEDCYLDAAKIYSNNTSKILTGLEYLEGKIVEVVADGAHYTDLEVKNGKIEIPVIASEIIAGLGYSAELTPLSYEFNLQDGSSLMRRKNIIQIKAVLYDTVGGEFRCGEEVNWYPLFSYDVDHDSLDAPLKVFNGEIKIPISGGYVDHLSISIRHNIPFPFKIKALGSIFNIVE